MTATAECGRDLERRVAAFEAAWASDGPPDPLSFAPGPGDPGHRSVLLELLRVELELRHGRGDRDVLSSLRRRHAVLFTDPGAVAALAFEDYRLRLDAGDTPSRAEYAGEYGVATDDWPESVALPRTEPVLPSGEFPRPGASFGPFRIVALLGRGSFGRVYLAEDRSLSSRRVAIKVSTKHCTAEPDVLARLQHTNVVPVYSTTTIDRYQVTVMPYLGSTTVADLIDALRGKADRPRSGRSILDTVNAKRESTLRDSPSPVIRDQRPAEDFTLVVGTMTFVDAVLWMTARLADALDHAHRRGVFHRDVKPANVLFTDEGVPMLLDFNLAAVADREAGWGGTPAYMAPEVLARSTTPYDARADVYSLGVVAYELLTGRRPKGDGRDTDPRVLNPAVSPAAAAVIRTCLAADPARRYQTARDLADDLDRHLRHEPLHSIREPSLRERAEKWARRHPRASSTGAVTSVAAVAFVVLGILAMSWRASVVRSRERDETVATVARFQSELPALVNGLYFERERSDDVAALSQWADRLDASVGPAFHPVRLTPDERAGLAWDLGLAHAIVARREDGADVALTRYDRALDAFASAGRIPNAILDERNALAARANRAARDGSGLVRDEGWGECLKGYDDFRRGRYREAVTRFTTATRSDPTLAWAWLALGNARSELGEWAEAEGAFQAFLALKPHEPMGSYNRGLTLVRRNRLAEAMLDFDRTLTITPDHAPARYQRGLARQALGDLTGAEADFDRLLENATSVCGLVARANVRERRGDRAGAERDRLLLVGTTPDSEVDFVARGLDRAARGRPKDAIADFDAALRLNPRSFAALQNKAAVLDAHVHDERAAIDTLTRALEFYPDALESRAGRAVLLARANRRDEAHADARACLVRRPSVDVVYQMANVYALTSRTHPADRDVAMRHLETALREGYGHDLLDSDPDLAPIRDTAAFRDLAKAARKDTP